MLVLSSKNSNNAHIKEGMVKLQKSYSKDLNGPLSLALDKKSHIVVCEEFGHYVRKFDKDFTCLWHIGGKGDKPGEFCYPTGVAIDDENNCYITDRWNHRVQKFDKDGNFLSQFGTYGSDEGKLSEPWGIACLSSGDILVVDHGNARLVRFDKNGIYKGAFGDCGTSINFYEGEQFKRTFHFQKWLSTVNKLNTIESNFYALKYDVGELEYPEDVSVDAHGTIYVTDRVGGQVVVFDAAFGLRGTLCARSHENFPREPSAIFAYDEGCFIAEESSGKLYWYRAEGCVVFNFNTLGVKISDIYFEKDKNLLYLCDTWHSVIYLYTVEGA